MVPAADYAKAVSALTHPAPPAYVSFVTSASARGIERDSDPLHTVYVRTKDGAVVAGTLENASTGHYQSNGDTNPVSKPAFVPGCYSAADERQTNWEGKNVLRITLKPTCASADADDAKSDNPFDALYVDPATLAPLGLTGTIDADAVNVDLEEHFGRFGSYTYATDLSVHVRGHGLLFWLRESATVLYSDYQFYATLPKGVVRRQAGSSH